MRAFTITCGTLVLLGGLAAAQEPNEPVQPIQRRSNPWLEQQQNGQPQNGVVYMAPRPVPVPSTPALPGAGPAQTGPATVPVASPIVVDLPPPTLPQVSFVNGQLAVQAPNSTLGSILTAIRNKTGIRFEGLEGDVSERVVIFAGPAPEGEVLSSILGGSGFSFIVVDRTDSPGIVQRVILTPRAGTPTGSDMTARRPAATPAAGDDEDNEEASNGDPEPQDVAARPPVVAVQPQLQDGNHTFKTPEQYLEELKQRQRQGTQPAPSLPPPTDAPRKVVPQ